MFEWKSWLKRFDRWENATAALTTEILRSPLLLNPIGSAFTSTFQAKSGLDHVLQRCWSALGLPTRGEQERVLHALNQLESRLYDLEEKLADLRAAPLLGSPVPPAGPEALDAAPAAEAPPPVLQRSKRAAPRKPRTKRPSARAAAATRARKARVRVAAPPKEEGAAGEELAAKEEKRSKKERKREEKKKRKKKRKKER